MQLSLSLIQSFLTLNVSVETVEKTLTLLGIEVDRVIAGDPPALELSLTPNLGHALSALGIARELSAALNIPLIDNVAALQENEKSPIEKKVQLQSVDGKAAPRYMGRLIEHVHVGPSPAWLQKELSAAGMNAINNVVDATNFILLKRGQPLHAFDLDRIEGRTVRVERSKEPHTFLGLDGVERTIPEGTLWIYDAKRPIALAGILGGDSSAVHDGTTTVFLEAAFFDPMTVRKTAKRSGIRTESAIRFEKGVDPSGVQKALDEAAHLIALLGKGTIAKGTLHATARAFPDKEIAFRMERARSLIGIPFSQTEVRGIFTRLHFGVKEEGEGKLLVRVPAYRFDVAEEIDLIEEVIRIYGYNNIEKSSPLYRSSTVPHDPMYLFEKEVQKRCTAQGLQQILTADLISPKMASLAVEFLRPKTALLKTVHAKTEEYSILRPSLLPGILQIVKFNIDQKNHDLCGFELGRIHFLEDSQNVELPMLSLVLTGHATPQNWGSKGDDVDFYTLKGILENLLDALKVKGLGFTVSHHPSLHPKRQMDLTAHGQTVGSFGEVHPALLAKCDIKQQVLFAEINLEALLPLHHAYTHYKTIPQLPASERDWTLALTPSVHIGDVLHTMRAFPSALLESVALIDLYEKEGEAKKNATFRCTYRDLQQTIAQETVEAEHKKFLDYVTKLLDK